MHTHTLIERCECGEAEAEGSTVLLNLSGAGSKMIGQILLHPTTLPGMDQS